MRRAWGGNAEWQQRTVNLAAVQSSLRNTSPSIHNVSHDFPNKATIFITSLLPCVVETLDVMMTSLPATHKNRVDLDAPNMKKETHFRAYMQWV